MGILLPNDPAARMRHIVRLAAILNIAYFGIEFGVALAIRSVALFGIAIVNPGAARAIYQLAREEQRAAVV